MVHEAAHHEPSEEDPPRMSDAEYASEWISAMERYGTERSVGGTIGIPESLREELRRRGGVPPQLQPDPYPGVPGSPQNQRQWLPTWSAQEFMNFVGAEELEMMGEGHLTRGSFTLLAGYPGVGKSRAALGLAVAGISGVPWLGHAMKKRFRTLILQCENGPLRLKRELAEALDGQPEEILREWLHITPPPPFGLAFSEPAFRAELTRKIAEFQPGLLIIDPFNRVAEGDKLADYRAAIHWIESCLPEELRERPAVVLVHHLRKRSTDPANGRAHGRDLLQEVAGSYQIGSTARCAFVLEAASSDTTDNTVVLTCCKNNDGLEGTVSAWYRCNGLFEPHADFDMEAFLEGSAKPFTKKTRIPFMVLAKALRGMLGASRQEAVARLVDAGACEKSRAYALIRMMPEHIVEDEKGKFSWCEEGIREGGAG